MRYNKENQTREGLKMKSNIKDFEKLVTKIMRDFEKDGTPVTREEAEEVAKMEIKAGSLKNYVSTKKPKAETAKEKKPPKIDPVKRLLIEEVAGFLKHYTTVSDVSIENEQRVIKFSINEESYSLTLTKHRKR